MNSYWNGDASIFSMIRSLPAPKPKSCAFKLCVRVFVCVQLKITQIGRKRKKITNKCQIRVNLIC